MKSLCDQLGITINELLSGERIAKEDYQTKFEENVLSTIDYSNKKKGKAKKRKYVFLSIIGCISIINACSTTQKCCNFNASQHF